MKFSTTLAILFTGLATASPLMVRDDVPEDVALLPVEEGKSRRQTEFPEGSFGDGSFDNFDDVGSGNNLEQSNDPTGVSPGDGNFDNFDNFDDVGSGNNLEQSNDPTGVSPGDGNFDNFDDVGSGNNLEQPDGLPGVTPGNLNFNDGGRESKPNQPNNPTRVRPGNSDNITKQSPKPETAARLNSLGFSRTACENVVKLSDSQTAAKFKCSELGVV